MVDVVEENDHLGQIISGKNQIEKNIDERLKKGRNSLFSLLGAGFAYKCNLSPALKLHLFRTFTCPILRSGLSTFSLRPYQCEPLALLQRKILKSIFKLSKTAPTPAIHFLAAELPIEGKLHRDMFSLFYSVWTNPGMKIHDIVKYLLDNSPENSRTWSIRMRQLATMYGLEDPLQSILKDPPTKAFFKEQVLTKITAFHENKLRKSALNNSKMLYFNVNICNLRGRYHPAICNVTSAKEVEQMRPHLKMLLGDYLTYKVKYEQSGGSPHCRLCYTNNPNNPNKNDNTVCHILTSCLSLQDTRERILCEIRQLCSYIDYFDFSVIEKCNETLTQFILDPCSLNLSKRINVNDEKLPLLFIKMRNLCWALDKERMSKLNEINNKC